MEVDDSPNNIECPKSSQFTLFSFIFSFSTTKIDKINSKTIKTPFSGPEKPTNIQDIPQSGETDDLISQQFNHLSPKWKNWWIRITMSWLMLFGFIFVGYMGPIAIVLLVLAIQIKCFHEVCSRIFRFFEVISFSRWNSLITLKVGK